MLFRSSELAQAVSDRWIADGRELYVSAGYSCYCWLIGNRKDEEFETEKLDAMLEIVRKTMHTSPARAQVAMNRFLAAVGVSYLSLHEKALSVALAMGTGAAEEIQNATIKGRLGFKRKHVRC